MIIYVIREGKTFYLLQLNYFSLKFTKSEKAAKLYHDEKDAYSDMGKVYITLLKKKEKIDDIGVIYPDHTKKSINDFAM